jgi:hypothetical protein
MAAALAGRWPLWLGTIGATGVVGLVVWLVVAHQGPDNGGSEGSHGSDPHAFFHGPQPAGQSRPEQEDPIMKRERLKQAAVFFGVVLPALGAGAGQAEDDRKLEQLAVAACVEMNEKSYECREEFADAFVEMRVKHAKQPPTPQERAKLREKGLRDLELRGSGSTERKRAICEKMIGQMGVRAKQSVQEHHPSLQACYAKDDCKQRIACIMPIIERVHDGELKHHR